MIASMGSQRIFLILLLVGLCGGIYFFNTQMLAPSIKKNEREVRKLRSELREMTDNTNKLSQGIELFNEQREKFAEIDRNGFFNTQNRIEARTMLDAMQEESRLKGARYNIKPAVRESSDELRDAGYHILRTDIDFELGAVQDSDIYEYIYLLNHGFPGIITIKNLEIEKIEEVTQPLLRNIGMNAQFNPILRARFVVEWRTMVPDTTLSAQGRGR
ncbi:MAG: hypothetical protein AAF988_06275 [Pseudomonadota bacterium]